MRPRGRKVLVVGATGRLGVAIARALAQRGDEVVLTARDQDKLEALARDVGSLRPVESTPGAPGPRPDGSAHFVCADLTSDGAPEAIVDGVRRAVGRLDDVVLACGPFPRTPFEALVRADLNRTLTVHAVAPLLLVHALAADLADSRGAVVALTDSGVGRP